MAKSQYCDFTDYYVEIIPSNGLRYNKEFTPSDNKKKQRKLSVPNIKVIDGYSFYEIATGQKDALKDLYMALPRVISDIIGNHAGSIAKDPLFNEFSLKHTVSSSRR
ncbi:Eco47II family restriction endonuclease [Candidatus Uhrbacteria bacterium]|nr:Eco47II family restriction endonuclease [Candidatus Uhrbacteria bacterium]